MIFRRKTRPKWLSVEWENDDGTVEQVRIYPRGTVTWENRNGKYAMLRGEYDGETLRLLPLCLMVQCKPAEARKYADAIERRASNGR
jgi:hypothetical protein